MKNTFKFETGASNAASNNLVLSVMNDGKIYDERIHAAKRLLQGMESIRSFREIANAEANKQRQQFDEKFKAKEITEAGEIVLKDSIRDAIELIHYKWEDQGYMNKNRMFDGLYL